MESFIHTRRLADYLEMAHMGPSEFKKAVETRVPRELAAGKTALLRHRHSPFFRNVLSLRGPGALMARANPSSVPHRTAGCGVNVPP